MNTTIPSKEIQLINVQKYTKDMNTSIIGDEIEREDGSLRVSFESGSENKLIFWLWDRKNDHLEQLWFNIKYW